MPLMSLYSSSTVVPESHSTAFYSCPSTSPAFPLLTSPQNSHSRYFEHLPKTLVSKQVKPQNLDLQGLQQGSPFEVWAADFVFWGQALEDLATLEHVVQLEKRWEFLPDRDLKRPLVTLTATLQNTPKACDLSRGEGCGVFRVASRSRKLVGRPKSELVVREV